MYISFIFGHISDYYSLRVNKLEVLTNRFSGNTNFNINTNHVEDEEEDYKGLDEHNMNIDGHNMSMYGGQ